MEQRARALHDEKAWLRPITVASEGEIGWIGGAPGGHTGLHTDADFVAQIDLSALPDTLWHGCAPRHGWLRLFLDEDGQPILDWSANRGDPSAKTRTKAPRWGLRIVEAPGPQAHAAPLAFDLTHPGCQPVDLESALGLLSALHAELDRSTLYLDRLEAEARDVPPEQPGANGIWGRVLRSAAETPAKNQPRQIANPGVIITGRRDIANARAILDRLGEVFERLQAGLPPAALSLLSSALEHLQIPLFLSEAAPDVDAAPGAPAPVRIYQRNVAASRSAWALEGTPRSRWAEDWQAGLTARACAALADAPDCLPDAARTFWATHIERQADAATIEMGDVWQTADGPVAVLLRLPASPLTGWEWGADALEICLPLAALAKGDFSQAIALWAEDQAAPSLQ